tara:strand:+ start:7959 stop:8192 length:234 start_codon:yes stop_codon:yes gene_type:complete
MLLLILNLSIASAQETDKNVRYNKRTEIDFEGLDITGEMIKPTGALVQSRQTAKFNPLIKIRTDFNLEMAQSINNVK